MREERLQKPEKTPLWLERWAIGLLAVIGMVLAGALALQALGRAAVNAPAVACRNNIKQIYLSARVWALDHHTNGLPGDFFSFTNDIYLKPKVLHCPMDGEHFEASGWSSLTLSNISYLIVTPGAADGSTNEYITCPFHHTVILANGKISRQPSLW